MTNTAQPQKDDKLSALEEAFKKEKGRSVEDTHGLGREEMKSMILSDENKGHIEKSAGLILCVLKHGLPILVAIFLLIVGVRLVHYIYPLLSAPQINSIDDLLKFVIVGITARFLPIDKKQ